MQTSMNFNIVWSDRRPSTLMGIIFAANSANHYIEQISVFNPRGLKWTNSSPLGRILLQVRMAITSTEPSRPARLDFNTGLKTYTVHEAVESYRRVATAHGWQISKDTEELIW
ncbi:hypothetical protein N7535_002143 [Penicillium sp. DV-2018c]|nr:hypothetical protein N7535_002143 [Penicillium sp. DV-2018c]